MRKILVMMFFCFFQNMIAEEEPVCHKCKIIREENKKKINPYDYYEDYKKDNPDETKKLLDEQKSARDSKG